MKQRSLNLYWIKSAVELLIFVHDGQRVVHITIWNTPNNVTHTQAAQTYRTTLTAQWYGNTFQLRRQNERVSEKERGRWIKQTNKQMINKFNHLRILIRSRKIWIDWFQCWFGFVGEMNQYQTNRVNYVYTPFDQYQPWMCVCVWII